MAPEGSLLDRTSRSQQEKAQRLRRMTRGVMPLTHLDAGIASVWLVRSLTQFDATYVVTLVPDLKRATCDCIHNSRDRLNVCAHILAAGLEHVARAHRAMDRATQRAAAASMAQNERERA